MIENKRGEIVAALLLDAEEFYVILTALLSLRESDVLDDYMHCQAAMSRICDQIATIELP